mgnify:CR=1 FL=1
MRNLNSGKLWPVLIFLLTLCGSPQAMAATVTRTLDINGFDRVLVLSPYQLEIVQANDFLVEVTVDSQYADALETWKEGPTLVLGVKPDPFNASTLKARVTLPALNSIEILGMGSATLTGFNQHSLAVSILGTGRVQGDSMWIDELNLKVVGTGGVDFGDIGPLQYANVGLDGVNESTLNMAAGSTIKAVLMGITKLNYWGSNVYLDVAEIGFSKVKWLGESPATQVPPGIGVFHSGSWYASEQSGHGFSIEIGAREDGSPLAVVYWYTYDDFGNPIFLTGSGVPDGNVLEVNFKSPVGMVFGEFDPGTVVREEGGVALFEFSDKDHGVFDYVPSGFTASAWGHTPVESLPLVKLFGIRH